MRNGIRSTAWAFILVALMARSVMGQTVKTVAVLYGGDVPPAKVLTAAVGYAEFTVDAAAGQASFDVTLVNLSTRVTGAHVHVGSVGLAGPIVLDLRPANQSGDYTLKAMLTAADVKLLPDLGIRTPSDAFKALMLGATYLDVHTERNGEGEIRGQIFPTDTSMSRTTVRALSQRR